MHTIITTEADLHRLPVGSVVSSPLPDTESNVAERTSDGFWLVTGVDALFPTTELFEWADAPFTVIRHGYDDEYTNLDRAIEIVDRLHACDAIVAELKRAFAHRELEGGYLAALTHPLWEQASAERKRLQDSLTILV